MKVIFCRYFSIKINDGICLFRKNVLSETFWHYSHPLYFTSAKIIQIFRKSAWLPLAVNLSGQNWSKCCQIKTKKMHLIVPEAKYSSPYYCSRLYLKTFPSAFQIFRVFRALKISRLENRSIFFQLEKDVFRNLWVGIFSANFPFQSKFCLILQLSFSIRNSILRKSHPFSNLQSVTLLRDL